MTVSAAVVAVVAGTDAASASRSSEVGGAMSGGIVVAAGGSVGAARSVSIIVVEVPCTCSGVTGARSLGAVDALEPFIVGGGELRRVLSWYADWFKDIDSDCESLTHFRISPRVNIVGKVIVSFGDEKVK